MAIKTGRPVLSLQWEWRGYRGPIAARRVCERSPTAGATNRAGRCSNRGRTEVPMTYMLLMIDGFFIVACDTREAALAIAERCPAAEWGTVEVRSLAPCHDDSNA
ncbi:MAG: hypothetical protein IT503_01255 [Burkholderiaceae bacterium]|nr:hypothetical protein [Burkholderiaceae bacterium]